MTTVSSTIFNPKPLLKSSECQLSPAPHVLAPGAFISDNTVYVICICYDDTRDTTPNLNILYR